MRKTEAQQRADFLVKEAKRRAGKGWSLLGDELQEGLVALQIVWMIQMQANETLALNPALARFVEIIGACMMKLDEEANR